MSKYDTKVNLLNGPSPLEFLPNLSEKLGPKIYVKRDDLGGRGGGGNKLRKYERIVADALERGADTLIIAGHYQSNASRLLVATACQLGLHSIVVSKPMIPEQNPSFNQNGNALLMKMMNAHIIEIDMQADYLSEMDNIAHNIRQEGGTPYIIPFGGSNFLGSLGYVDCAQEILHQYKEAVGGEPSHIVVTAGSGGTMAGLVAGTYMAGAKTKVHGISVLHKDDTIHNIVDSLVAEILEKLGTSSSDIPEIHIDTNYVGKGYGLPSDQGKEAMMMTASSEALFLCPVYTGKAMSGLIGNIREGKITSGDSVVFVHTGGYPLVHAYYDVLG